MDTDNYRDVSFEGLISHLEIISNSGCFSGKEGGCSYKGHQWVPVVELGPEHPAIEKMGWSASQDKPLREAEWAFNPYCTDCRRDAKTWLTRRGITRKQWRRIVETFGIYLPLNSEEKRMLDMGEAIR